MSTPTVVFDLDGTLVDTAPDLVAALNVVLKREGFPTPGFEDARNMVGAGARRMIELALARLGVAQTTADIERMYNDFIAYYTAHVADNSRPFPGAMIALERLAGRACKLAVCTNKLEGLSRLLLQRLGMAAQFAAICGQDTFGIAKPDPEMLRRTIELAGGALGRAVLVGDSATDIQTAQAAGVPIIAVDFGYTDVPVAKLNPDRIIGNFEGLPAAVFDLLGAEA